MAEYSELEIPAERIRRFGHSIKTIAGVHFASGPFHLDLYPVVHVSLFRAECGRGRTIGQHVIPFQFFLHRADSIHKPVGVPDKEPSCFLR